MAVSAISASGSGRCRNTGAPANCFGAGDYPTRPLTLIVPFAAGGTKADFAGRVANVRFRKAGIRLIRRDVRL